MRHIIANKRHTYLLAEASFVSARDKKVGQASSEFCTLAIGGRRDRGGEERAEKLNIAVFIRVFQRVPVFTRLLPVFGW